MDKKVDRSPFEASMNILLVRIYRDLELLEEKMLNASSLNLSISEIHMLEAVRHTGENGASTISQLSDFLSISLPSVTSSINKLEARGFVERKRSAQDGRVVQVLLTRKGRKADRAHLYFHRTMVREIASSLSEAEQKSLIQSVTKLELFLKNNIQKYKNK